MRIRDLIISLLTVLPLTAAAQAKDKAEADMMVWEELTAGYDAENYHPRLNIQDSQIRETAEKGIWLVVTVGLLCPQDQEGMGCPERLPLSV